MVGERRPAWKLGDGDVEQAGAAQSLSVLHSSVLGPYVVCQAAAGNCADGCGS